MSRSGSCASFLRVEGVVAILLMSERVGLHLVLSLLSHKIRLLGAGKVYEGLDKAMQALQE